MQREDSTNQDGRRRGSMCLALASPFEAAQAARKEILDSSNFTKIKLFC